MNTGFSSIKNLVIQLVPSSDAGEIQINGRRSKRTTAMVFIPKLDGSTYSCPLNYFQDFCSLTEQWILDDKSHKINLNGINNLAKVIITTKDFKKEEIEIDISKQMKRKLLRYFKLDIQKNLNLLKGFDCHAFVCFLINLKCVPESPCFTFYQREPEIGEVVALCNADKLPESIKHWAIYLGNNLYLSKFGKSTGKTDSHISVMNIRRMHELYETKFIHIATPLPGAEKWDGKFKRTK